MWFLACMNYEKDRDGPLPINIAQGVLPVLGISLFSRGIRFLTVAALFCRAMAYPTRAAITRGMPARSGVTRRSSQPLRMVCT